MAIGERLAGHTLIEQIGEGRFGQVWRALFEGRPCAVKLLTRSLPVAQLRREVEAQVALGRLPMPDRLFFPRVEWLDLEHQPPYLRMELVEGIPLEEAVADRALDLPARLEIGRQILEALEVVHRHGFVHGDLTPRNVMLTRGGGTQIRLIDVGFGALEHDEADDPAQSDTAMERGAGVAAPLYAAPERFSGGCGKASDLFSFGKVLYRLITGESPHAVKPVSRRRPELSCAWDEFLFRCLEERPEDRFIDAGEALQAFDALSRERGEVRVAEPTRPCPTCGERIAVEASRCRVCGAELGETARRIIESHARPAEPVSYVFPVFFTFLMYFLCWVPGVVSNLHFLSEARRTESKLGEPPPGAEILNIMIWIFTYLPLIFMSAVVVYFGLRA